MEFNVISIKSFISDMPRVINENFSKIKKFIESIYDFSTNTLLATAADIKGQLKANTVKANNIEVNGHIYVNKNGSITIEYKDPSTNLYNVIDVGKAITDLQKKVEILENN